MVTRPRLLVREEAVQMESVRTWEKAKKAMYKKQYERTNENHTQNARKPGQNHVIAVIPPI